MSRWMTLPIPEGTVQAWYAEPQGAPRAGLVVVQEIFGANAHIRSVVGRLAQAGYRVLALAMFDPVQPGVDLPYDDAGMDRGREHAAALGFDGAVAIVAAATAWLRRQGVSVGVVGFCWGGSVALLANTRLGLPAVSYYGARSLPFLPKPLAAPMLFHFGRDDALIPPQDIQRHRDSWPEAGVEVHDGGHAFNRDVDPRHFHPDSATTAWRQTLAFFEEHLP